MLNRALTLTKLKEELHRVYELSCDKDDFSLYRRLLRQRYYMPEMAKDVIKMAKACTKYQEPFDVEEAFLFF